MKITQFSDQYWKHLSVRAQGVLRGMCEGWCDTTEEIERSGRLSGQLKALMLQPNCGVKTAKEIEEAIEIMKKETLPVWPWFEFAC